MRTHFSEATLSLHTSPLSISSYFLFVLSVVLIDCRGLLQNIVYKRLCFYNQEALRRSNTTNQDCGWSRSAPDTELRVLCCLACAVLHVPVLCSFSMPSPLSFHPKPSTRTSRPPSLTPKPSTINPQTPHPQPYPYFFLDPLLAFWASSYSPPSRIIA